MPKTKEEILKELEKVKLENKLLRKKAGISENESITIQNLKDAQFLQDLLDQGEQKYRALFELSPVGIMLEDKEGYILDVNNALCLSFGYHKEEFLKMRAHDLVVPENYDKVEENIKRILDGEILHHVEKDLRKDGSISYTELKETKITLDDGTECILVISNDITDRIKFEKSLRASEQRYRTLFESAEDAIFMTDGEKFIDCNPTTLKMFNCNRQQIINQPIYKFSPPAQPDGNDSRKMILKKIKLAIEGNPQNFEWTLKSIDDILIDTEMKFNRIELSDNNFVLAIVRDITSRKQAENELLKSEEKYRTLAESAQDVIFIVDKEYRYQYVNDYGAYAINLTKNKILGRKITDILSREVAQNQIAAFQKVISTGQPYYTEIKLPISNIDEVWWDVRLMPMLSANNEVEMIMGISRDITERKRSEEQIIAYNKELQLSNDSKDKFFSILAHDLKSPFTSLLGYSDLIANDLIDLSPEETKDAVTNINKVARNIFSLLENLLEWSRIQTDRIENKPEEIEIYHIVQNVIDLFQNNARAKNLTFSNLIKEDTIVYADENFIFTVIRNLISNATKFSNQDGQVIIKSNVFGDFTEISVEDNGIGMTEEEMKMLFRIDVHHTKLGTHKEKGTGLGLILCKEYIEKSGGKISVSSQVNKGSIFTFSLPKHTSSK